MTKERWQRVTELFDAAVDLPPSDLDEFLREHCSDDTELELVLREMIRQNPDSGMLDHPVWQHTTFEPVFAPDQMVAGRYRVARFIARGGMGEVYEADDQELKERVALKTLLPAIADDTRMIARFKQEIQLSRKIAHPNVCRVFDLARHPADGSAANTVFFLTMEFLDGETLAARLEHDGRLGMDAGLPILAQVAEALDAAHRAGIIHGDLKPSNVVLAERAVVTDFGLARSYHASAETTATLTGKLMGTLDYMAPELLTGESASAQSDIYALGMMAYKMVTGSLPFPSQAPLAAAIRRSRVPVPSPRSRAADLDPAWERAILRALAPDPARRFARAGDFVKALRGEKASLTVPLPGMTRRRWAGVVLALIMLVAAGLGWRAWRTYRNRQPAEALAFYQKGVDDIHAGAYFAATKTLGEAVQIAPRFALAHARLAEAWMELEDSDKAAREMLLARRGGGSGLSAVQRLQLDAIELSITREFTAAASRYQQILKSAGAASGDIYLDLGNTFDKAGQQPKALENYLLAVRNAPRSAAAWLRLAGQHSLTSQSVQAQDEFGRAEALYQVTSNFEGLTEVAYQRSADALRRGRLEESATQAKKALEMAHTTGNIHQQIRATLQLGSNAFLSGDPVEAERHAMDAISVAQANHIESLAVRGIRVLGDAYKRKGDYDGAVNRYQEALDLARRNSSQRLAAFALLSLASLHQEGNRAPDDAARESGEALAYFRPNHFARESCQCLTIIGRVQRDRADPAALDSFQQCLRIAEEAQDAYQMSLAHESLGRLLTVQEHFVEAQQHHRQELQLSTDAARTGYAALHCADAMWPMGQYEEAGEMLAKAESVAAKYPDVALHVAYIRAAMLLSRRRFAEALAVRSKAIAGAPSSADDAQFTAIAGLAQIALGSKIEGRRNCEAALKAAERFGDIPILREVRLETAQAFLDTGDAAAALSLLRKTEPALAGLPHSHWRALALEARADRAKSAEYAVAAKKELDELARQWGAEAFRRYMGRPDLRELSRALGQPAAAH